MSAFICSNQIFWDKADQMLQLPRTLSSIQSIVLYKKPLEVSFYYSNIKSCLKLEQKKSEQMEVPPKTIH